VSGRATPEASAVSLIVDVPATVSAKQILACVPVNPKPTSVLTFSSAALVPFPQSRNKTYSVYLTFL